MFDSRLVISFNGQRDMMVVLMQVVLLVDVFGLVLHVFIAGDRISFVIIDVVVVGLFVVTGRRDIDTRRRVGLYDCFRRGLFMRHVNVITNRDVADLLYLLLLLRWWRLSIICLV